MDINTKTAYDYVIVTEVVTVCEEANKEDKKLLSALVTQLLLSYRVCKKHSGDLNSKKTF